MRASETEATLVTFGMRRWRQQVAASETVGAVLADPIALASRQVTPQTPVTFKMMWDGIHELCPYYWDTLGGNAGQENRLVEGVVSDEWETDSDGD